MRRTSDAHWHRGRVGPGDEGGSDAAYRQATAGVGLRVVVENGAGASASFPDDAYVAAGALVVGADEAWGADVVIRVNRPTEEEIGRLADGATSTDS